MGKGSCGCLWLKLQTKVCGEDTNSGDVCKKIGRVYFSPNTLGTAVGGILLLICQNSQTT